MRISFSCPSCNAPGSVDEAFAGRQVRCKQCRHPFALPNSGEAQADGYGLVEPARKEAPPSSNPGSVYAPARGDEPRAARPRASTRPGPRAPRRKARREGSGFAWRAWLVRGGILGAVALGLVALIAPRGSEIAGLTLVILGMVMVLVGYAAGAFGAFSEDFLYGILYLAIPIYTAYYLVTRWDDLWRWFACSTAGVGLVLAGTQILRWAGVEA